MCLTSCSVTKYKYIDPILLASIVQMKPNIYIILFIICLCGSI